MYDFLNTNYLIAFETLYPGQNGIRSRDLRIPSPALLKLDHAASSNFVIKVGSRGLTELSHASD